MPVTGCGSIGSDMRGRLTREGLQSLMKEIARSATGRKAYRVYFVGGGTAVHSGWRESTIDANLYSAEDTIFRNVQDIKERLRLNIELARPEDFVPPLTGSMNRHLFIDTIGRVSFYHYDPYVQLLSKVVRGFNRDIQDADNFIAGGMVDTERFRSLVQRIPARAYAEYPALSRQALLDAVDGFLVRTAVR